MTMPTWNPDYYLRLLTEVAQTCEHLQAAPHVAAVARSPFVPADLARAAAAYAIFATFSRETRDRWISGDLPWLSLAHAQAWPWSHALFLPVTPRQDLMTAVGYLLLEIERMDRDAMEDDERAWLASEESKKARRAAAKNPDPDDFDVIED